MGSVADLYASVRADMSEFDSDLQKGLTKSADKSAKTFGDRFKKRVADAGMGDLLKVGASIGAGFAAFGVASAAFGGLTDRIGDAIGAASDLAESQSKVDAVFVGSSDIVHRWASDLDTAYGISEQAALEAAGTFGNFIQALGGGEREANEMSRSLVELAGDLGSFNNVARDEVLVSLRSGLAGEAEPMRRLGVDISAARVEAILLADGVEKVNGKFTEAQKVTARYQAIMEDTVTAQGDAVRTGDALAGRQRKLDAQFANLSATLGAAFMPAAELGTGAMQALADIALFLAGGSSGDGVLDGLIEDLEATRDGMVEVAAAAAASEGDWALTGTIFDSAVDGIFALQGAMEDLGLAPVASQMREWREELAPLAASLGASESELGVFVLRGVQAGLTLDDLRQSLRRAREGVEGAHQPLSSFEVAVEGAGDATEEFGDQADDASDELRELTGQVDLAKGGFKSFWREMREEQRRIRHFIRNPDKLRDELDKIETAIDKSEKRKQKLLKDGFQEGEALALEAIDRRIRRLRGRQAEFLALGQLYGNKAEAGMEAAFDPTLVVSGVKGLGRALGDKLGAAFGGRAFGGPVSRDTPYVVGERGPEVFVPTADGRIEPNTSIGGETHYHVRIEGLPMQADTPFRVVQQLRRAARYGVAKPRQQGFST